VNQEEWRAASHDFTTRAATAHGANKLLTGGGNVESRIEIDDRRTHNRRSVHAPNTKRSRTRPRRESREILYLWDTQTVRGQHMLCTWSDGY